MDHRPHDAPTLSRDALRELDRLCVEEFGIPSIVLMENAARGIAAQALLVADTGSIDAAVILCGPGNNGGDGLALARHLHNADISVLVMLTSPPDSCSGDARVNLEICQRMGLTIEPPPPEIVSAGDWLDDALRFHPAGPDPSPCLVVDALLGTGLDRAVRGFILDVIRALNARTGLGPVLSVDLPSGLDADTGRPLGGAVRADLTVTLAARKRGFASPEAAAFTGRVVVEGIGAPRALIERLADGAAHGGPPGAG